MAYIKDNKVAIYATYWTKIENINVLTIKGSRFVAVPQSGKKNAKNYDVIDMKNRSDFYAQDISNKEIHSYLASLASIDEIEPSEWLEMVIYDHTSI